jgi:hypothetical protein
MTRLDKKKAYVAIARSLPTVAYPNAVCSSATEKQTGQHHATQPRIRRVSPAKACRGALGFRARQTRPQKYSVIREQSAGALARDGLRQNAPNYHRFENRTPSDDCARRVFSEANDLVYSPGGYTMEATPGASDRRNMLRMRAEEFMGAA